MRCAVYYHSGELTPKCLVADPTDQAVNRACIRVPLECRKHNAVYNILHYLVDDEFMPPNVSIYLPFKQNQHFLTVSLMKCSFLFNVSLLNFLEILYFHYS